MGFASYVVDNVVKGMTEEDWREFLIRRKYGRNLITELQAFLNEKYCNEEQSIKQQHYGELCNRAMYPGYYPPYHCNMSAKAYHLEQDGEIPVSQWKRRTPETFYLRKFGGSVFPVYMTDEEYDHRFFTSHDWCVEHPRESNGMYIFRQYPQYPARRMLCRKSADGTMVEYIRNTPLMK